MKVALESLDENSLPLQLSMERPVSRQWYRNFVRANPGLRIERTAQGEVLIMAPAASRSGHESGEVFRQLANWARQEGQGICFDSSSGFDLPDGSNRSPDACWVLRSRIRELTEEQREEYLPLCPDFVAEVRSKTDRLAALQTKMREYLANGAKLGWLIDPFERRVHIFRPGLSAVILEQPATVSGDPELPAFTLDLAPIWNPPF